MKKNYKLQNTNYKQNTKYKLQITNRKTVIGHWSFVMGKLGEKVRRFYWRLKASIPGGQTTFYKLHDIRYFDAFVAGSVQLKKPSGGPKGLWVPYAMGPLAAGGRRIQ